MKKEVHKVINTFEEIVYLCRILCTTKIKLKIFDTVEHAEKTDGSKDGECFFADTRKHILKSS